MAEASGLKDGVTDTNWLVWCGIDGVLIFSFFFLRLTTPPPWSSDLTPEYHQAVSDEQMPDLVALYSGRSQHGHHGVIKLIPRDRQRKNLFATILDLA